MDRARRYYSPEEAAEGLEAQLARHGRTGSAVYLGVLALVIAALAALPLVHVEVGVRSPGIVRPALEKHRLIAGASARVRALHVAPGAGVQAGHLVLSLDDADVAERAAVVERRVAELADAGGDLERLLAEVPDGGSTLPLATPRYRQERAQLAQELHLDSVREEQLERDLARARLLADRELLPRLEVEQRAFRLAELRMERAARVERQRSAWQATLAEVRAEQAGLLARRAELDEERARFVVRAPVAGTVVELAAVSPGSRVQAGDPVAVLSPEAELVAEVFVAPRDVGMIRAGAPVRLLVDAFRYTEWGTVPGRVVEVGEDYLTVDGAPAFRVRVALERLHLERPNGARGELRKGMTVQALFRTARRSLWQLLRDDVSDWLDPALGPTTVRSTRAPALAWSCRGSACPAASRASASAT